MFVQSFKVRHRFFGGRNNNGKVMIYCIIRQKIASFFIKKEAKIYGKFF